MPSPFSFPLSQPATGGAGGAVIADVSNVTPVDRFLGFGIIRPFQRDASDLAVAGGFELVRSAVGQVLGTRASSAVARGELPWRPQFGSKFYLLKHRKGDLLTEIARSFALEALGRWEPRVRVTQVGARFDREARRFFIRVRFNVIDRNVPGNNVILRDAEVEVGT